MPGSPRRALSSPKPSSRGIITRRSILGPAADGAPPPGLHSIRYRHDHVMALEQAPEVIAHVGVVVGQENSSATGCTDPSRRADGLITAQGECFLWPAGRVVGQPAQRFLDIGAGAGGRDVPLCGRRSAQAPGDRVPEGPAL